MNTSIVPAAEIARRIAAIERLHQVLSRAPIAGSYDAFTFTDANYQVMLARLRHPDEAHAGLATTRPVRPDHKTGRRD